MENEFISKHEHCWHETGLAFTMLSEGSDQVLCCHCGAKKDRRWRYQHERIEGHGPYFTLDTKVYYDE